MKNAFLIICCAFFLNSCEPSSVTGSASTHDDSLLAATTTRLTPAVNGVNSLRRIFKNVDTIEFQRKTILALTTDTSLSGQSRITAINNEIERLNAGIKRTKAEVQRLNEELETDSLLIDYVADSIRVLNQMLAESESALLDLEEHFDAKEDEYNDLVADYFALMAAYIQQRNQIDNQVGVIYTGYYAIDTGKDLARKGIIKSQNGFWSFVQSKELDPKTDLSAFTRCDKRNTLTVPISKRKARMITSHPKGSYRIEMEGAIAKRLVILDPVEFWKISQFLVIATD